VTKNFKVGLQIQAGHGWVIDKRRNVDTRDHLP